MMPQLDLAAVTSIVVGQGGMPHSTTWPALIVVGQPGGTDGLYVRCVPSTFP